MIVYFLREEEEKNKKPTKRNHQKAKVSDNSLLFEMDIETQFFDITPAS